MTTNRLEAFSDGVIAILITIMVLELKVPHGAHLEDLRALWPVFISYILSFIYLGIYWSNHHHMFQLVRSVRGEVLWANLHLLFWLSLVPFFTAWMGENDFAKVPTAAYGVPLLMAAVAYYTLQTLLIRHSYEDERLKHAVSADWKGKVSPLLYIAGIGLSLVTPWLGYACYTVVAVMWLIPDRRIEREIDRSGGANGVE